MTRSDAIHFLFSIITHLRVVSIWLFNWWHYYHG